MAKKTYTAAVDMKIQSRPIEKGQVIGTGDVDRGEFTPAKGLEKFVAADHVVARVQSGKIKVSDGPAEQDPDLDLSPDPNEGEKEASSGDDPAKTAKKKTAKKKTAKKKARSNK